VLWAPGGGAGPVNGRGLRAALIGAGEASSPLRLLSPEHQARGRTLGVGP